MYGLWVGLGVGMGVGHANSVLAAIDKGKTQSRKAAADVLMDKNKSIYVRQGQGHLCEPGAGAETER